MTLGGLRDVVHIVGRADGVQPAADEAEAFAVKAGFDPRPLPDYPFIRVVPVEVRAWREVNEIKGRVLMRGGEWVV